MYFNYLYFNYFTTLLSARSLSVVNTRSRAAFSERERERERERENPLEITTEVTFVTATGYNPATIA